jgi:hypothetical protein
VNINPLKNIALSATTWMLIILCSTFILVSALPFVMAMRLLVLYSAFLLSGHALWHALKRKSVPLYSAVALLILLQIWMWIISGFMAGDPYDSFMEWKGQWLPAVICFSIGIGLAYSLSSSGYQNYRSIVVMTICVPVIVLLLVNAGFIIHELFQKGRFVTQLTGITDNKANIGYLIALLEPIIIADLLQRFTKRGKLLPIPGWLSVAILALVVFSLITAGARNGIVIILFAFILGGLMMLKEIRASHSTREVAIFSAAILIFISAFAWLSYETDPRWKNLIKTIPIAWDIDRHDGWQSEFARDLPRTAEGERVDGSAYRRIAWAHEGWRLLMANPWGTEISRHTYYRLETEIHGRSFAVHSHNGWIDLGLNIGFPGLALWAGFLIILGGFGWRAWKFDRDALGLALALLAILFASRALLDATFRNHTLLQFMLVAGLLFSTLCFTKYPPKENEQPK